MNDDVKKKKKLISKGVDLHIEIDGKSLIGWSQYYYSNGEMVELLKAHGLYNKGNTAQIDQIGEMSGIEYTITWERTRSNFTHLN